MTDRFPKQVRLLAAGILSFALANACGVAKEQEDNPYTSLGISEFAFLKSGDPLVDWKSVRTFRAADGRTMQAQLVGIEAENALFRLPGNRPAKIPIDRFAKEDQRFIKEWQEISRYFNLNFQPLKDINHQVKAEIRDGAFAKKGKVHETRNFKFVCDVDLNALTVKDFSRMFEATYSMVRALPLGLEVASPPEGKFRVTLFSNKDQYHAAGGPANSAGVYIIKTREIMVPLSSLGLQKSGNTYRKASDYDPSTLIHEITHSVTHQWIQYLPMWMAEGLADYVSAIPYRDGAFTYDPAKLDSGISLMVSKNFGGDRYRLRLLTPEEFVYLNPDEFMNRQSQPEQKLVLNPVEPFQIKLQDNTDDSAGTREQIVIPVGFNPSTIVTQRYTSSMVLLHHLIKSGQVASLRRYLFAHLNHRWDSERYIDTYNQTLRDYHAEVKAQIADFDSQLNHFNDEINRYNELVDRKNSGEDVELPDIPEQPAIPEAIPVPEILSHPRKPEDFSTSHFLKKSVSDYLRLPSGLQP